jgi:hypothetical protein
MPQDFLNLAKGLAAPSEFSYSKKCLFSELNILPSSARTEYNHLLAEFFFLFPNLLTIYLLLAFKQFLVYIRLKKELISSLNLK